MLDFASKEGLRFQPEQCFEKEGKWLRRLITVTPES
jgi:hypothetical protein